MGTKDKERRVYPKEFKAEAVAPAEKHEKPVRQAAADLGVNENLLYRWMLPRLNRERQRFAGKNLCGGENQAYSRAYIKK